MVSSVTEIRPLRTEEHLSEPGTHVDLTDGVEQKSTTTVAMDFGRITIREDLVVYLFGTPGPAPVLVHVGRAGARGTRRGGHGRHPAARRLLRFR